MDEVEDLDTDPLCKANDSLLANLTTQSGL